LIFVQKRNLPCFSLRLFGFGFFLPSCQAHPNQKEHGWSDRPLLARDNCGFELLRDHLFKELDRIAQEFGRQQGEAAAVIRRNEMLKRFGLHFIRVSPDDSRPDTNHLTTWRIQMLKYLKTAVVVGLSSITPVLAQYNDDDTPTIALKDGESMHLSEVPWINHANCETVEMLQGPPQIKLEAEHGMVACHRRIAR
jgi:hypothetical protein